MSFSSDQLKDVRILIVDDEESLAWTIHRELQRLGAETQVAITCRQAIIHFQSFHPDLVICDLNLPDGSGLDLIKSWKSEFPQVPVILITAHGAIDSAISAFKLGVFDYLQKPFGLDELLVSISRAAEVAHLRQKVSQSEGISPQPTPLRIIGHSPAISELRQHLLKIAKSKVNTVFITGQTGTGKELAARALHEWSDHAQQAFIEINCASIPETLLESELFGYEKGAFTDARQRKLGLFEMARGGTLFLDEIGELPMKLQAKLLRALESRCFKRLGGTKDIFFESRIVAATNKDLKELIKNKEFRSDLYFRLCAISLEIPPLSERLTDIPDISHYLLDKIAQELEITPLDLSKEALARLMSHSWPGNIRELKNVLLRACVLNINGTQIEPKDLVLVDLEKSSEVTGFTIPPQGIQLEIFERDLLKQALSRADRNQSKAAELLGISRHTLRYRMEKFGLDAQATSTT